MIKSFQIANFKAFGEEPQDIPLKPLTIVFGANSSGKSSVLHSLLYAHHAAVTGELDVVYPKLGERLVDLGGFRQFIHGASKGLGNQLKFGFSIEPSTLAEHADAKRSQTNRLLKGPPSTVWAGLLEGLKSIKIQMSVHVELDNENKPKAGAKPQLSLYTVEMNGEQALAAFPTPDGTLRFSQINVDLPLFRRFLNSVISLETFSSGLPENPEPLLDEALTPLLEQLKLRCGGFMPEFVFLEDQDGVEILTSTLEPDVSPTATIRRHFPLLLNELVAGLAACVKNDLDCLAYLAPLRSYPPRHIGFAEGDVYNSKAGGGQAWLQVARDPGVRDKINSWLGDEQKLKTPYYLKVREYYSDTRVQEWAVNIIQRSLFDGSNQTLEDVFHDDDGRFKLICDEYLESMKEMNKDPEYIRTKNMDGLGKDELLSHLGIVLKYHHHGKRSAKTFYASEDYAQDMFNDTFLKSLQSDGPTNIVLTDKRTDTEVSHRDVGIGISQVLPVLAMAYGARREIISMEQPEIHLHPSLQAELADVFIESALGGNRNRCLLETHSEHLILRILRRIREQSKKTNPSIKASDVAVLYVMPDKEGSKIVEIRISDDGEFMDPWPGGFFPERMKELFGI